MKMEEQESEGSSVLSPVPKKSHPSMEHKTAGTRFFAEVSRCSIVKTELEDPFMAMVMYELHDVDIKPLDVSHIPPEAWPYSNCLFDVLSEKDNTVRFTRLRDFFLVLGKQGDISESVGLMHTVMHLWKFIYSVAMTNPTPRLTETIAFFLRAGIFQCMMRILLRCSEKKFLLTEYNRYAPYKALELVYAATQAAYTINEEVVHAVLDDSIRAYRVFYMLLCGKFSCLEEILACQLTSNFSCYPTGVTWLLDHPDLVGKIGYHLWSTYEVLYRNIHQYPELLPSHMKHLIYSQIITSEGASLYKALPIYLADLNTFVILCCLCNVCAAHPDDEPMERVEPSLLAVVKEGLFNNMGNVIYAIILNDNKYHGDLVVEKFLSFLSWSCFQRNTQKLALEQMRSLPLSRNDSPLYFEKDSYSKSRSVMSCIVTHACHLDYEKGSHFTTLALVYLLKEDDDVAMEMVKYAGDMLFDLSHSIYHAQMPSPDQKPISLKRIVLETMLRFGGSSYFNESGKLVKPTGKVFEEPVPECIHEARDFCERFVKQMTMKRYEKQKLVRCADEFKAEGNNFFTKKKYYSAIECYSKALETCPLTCTERRVTYHSNRAECYLQTSQSRLAVRDCTKALAMNPNNIRTRWRRVQALQNIRKPFAAALDLLTIRRHEDEAKQILGERLYMDLDQMICDHMDSSRFPTMAAKKCGPLVHQGTSDKEGSLCSDEKKNKLKLPPYKGKYYHDMFGYGHGNYLKQ